MFKVGDLVVSKHTGEVCLCEKIDGDEFYSNENKWHITTSYSSWQPKEGEWCWFYNTGEGKPFCGKFVTIIQKNNYTTYRAHNAWHECEYCEPFIGELPSFLKENR